MSDKKKHISIIYHQKNNSPKYLEIKKEKFLIFLVGLPAITLIALCLGALGLLQTSPFHLIDNYRQNAKARVAIEATNQMQNNINSLTSANKLLQDQIQELQKNSVAGTPTTPTITPTPAPTTQAPTPPVCPPVSVKAAPVSAIASSIGLSTLSLFKPIQGQKDKTQPASLNLTGFKVVNNKDSVNLQFNIINLLGGDVKLAGHIIVLMKNDSGLTVYPQQALNVNDSQINYAAGESFATQRFRPVDAGFVKPKKAGNYKFTVYIFSKTGDLIHFQSMNLPVHL